MEEVARGAKGDSAPSNGAQPGQYRQRRPKSNEACPGRNRQKRLEAQGDSSSFEESRKKKVILRKKVRLVTSKTSYKQDKIYK